MILIRTWWQSLSLRERWLVSIAGLLGGGVIGWWLILLPLTDGLSAAREAHGAALDRHAAIATRVAAIRALERAGAPPAANRAPLALTLSQLATEAGLTLSRNDPASGNSASVAIANARAPALLALLDRWEQAGLIAADLSIRRNNDGTVALTATMTQAN